MRVRFNGLLAVASLAICASLAWGASLSPLGDYTGEDGSQGRGITPDGKYIVGNSYNNGSATTRGLLWEAANPSVAYNLINGGRQSTVGTGIGYRTVAAGKELIAFGTTSSGPTTYGFDLFSGATPVQKWSARDANVYPNASLPAANSLAGTSGVNWYATFDKVAGSANRDMQTARGQGDPNGTMTGTYAAKNTPRETHIRGVSGTGRGIGSRIDADGGPMQNYYWDYVMPTMAQIKFKGLKAGSSDGEAWAVSLDGAKIGGYAPVDGGRAGNWPYLYDVASDTIVELPTQLAVPGFATNGIVYGLSADGRYAVGMDFTRGSERAVLWDTQAMSVLDLTDWASSLGILGAFTGNLRRAYSVGVNDLGQPVITGYGYAASLSTGAFTGFVLTVPEPTTLGLLVLGALPLLRRRRR
ncbi:MAG: hypothetical protein AMXMBFR13_05210 [Phycisphaerae bacterium]